MHQCWILSCLGSIGKRKKKIEGKVKAAYDKIIQPLELLKPPPTTTSDSPLVVEQHSDSVQQTTSKPNVNVSRKRRNKSGKICKKKLNKRNKRKNNN